MKFTSDKQRRAVFSHLGKPTGRLGRAYRALEPSIRESVRRAAIGVGLGLGGSALALAPLLLRRRALPGALAAPIMKAARTLYPATMRATYMPAQLARAMEGGQFIYRPGSNVGGAVLLARGASRGMLAHEFGHATMLGEGRLNTLRRSEGLVQLRKFAGYGGGMLGLSTGLTSRHSKSNAQRRLALASGVGASALTLPMFAEEALASARGIRIMRAAKLSLPALLGNATHLVPALSTYAALSAVPAYFAAKDARRFWNARNYTPAQQRRLARQVAAGQHHAAQILRGKA